MFDFLVASSNMMLYGMLDRLAGALPRLIMGVSSQASKGE